MTNENNFLKQSQEKYFLETFPLIQQITSQKFKPTELIESEDISQDVKLSLLIWKGNHSNTLLKQEEWLKFVNRVTFNRIKAFHRNQNKNTISLSEAQDNELCLLAKEKSQMSQQKGNTNMELNLLVSQMWEIIQTQSFFENCALLLKNDELSLHLILYRGCRIEEMAARLRLTETELDEIIKKLPLSDQNISELLMEKFQLKATPAAIRKARQRATDQLQAIIYQKRKKRKPNGKPSEHGKT